MAFTSLPFFIFMTVVFVMFVVMPANYRWIVLLVGSYAFYACFKVWYLLIALVAVSVISYGCGLLIHGGNSATSRKLWLWAGVTGNILILVTMKYLPFIIDNANNVLGLLSPDYTVPTTRQLVVIGISYYVFQSISYLVDIYLKILQPERHAGHFALCLSFFPKLPQGPIERSGALLPQLHTLAIPSFETLRDGARLFLRGMFKKIVIADRLAMFVDPVYNNVHAYHGISLIAATYLFAFQIYFDFSGYTDMALGVARLFGIRLTQNFNSPYMATSVADFWRRWHISFSSWILDYIFKPLQFSLRDWHRWGVPLALMATFLVSGIWHGASWCFVIWGGLHGVYLSTATLIKRRKGGRGNSAKMQKSRLLKVWQVVATFHLVCFAWIFFRARNLTDATYVVLHALGDIPRSLFRAGSLKAPFAGEVVAGNSASDLMTIMLLMSVVAAIGFWEVNDVSRGNKAAGLSFSNARPVGIDGVVWGVIVYLLLFWGAGSQSFIYQQF